MRPGPEDLRNSLGSSERIQTAAPSGQEVSFQIAGRAATGHPMISKNEWKSNGSGCKPAKAKPG
jgi:hypothetical protein